MQLFAEMKQIVANELTYRSRCKAFRKCSYGDRNRHRKYRVLCNKNKYASKQGLLSTVFSMLPNIIEARLHGYIPVVDLCRNSRKQEMLQEGCLAKKENAWEYYFTQPDRKLSLEEVRQSRYVEEQIKDQRNLYYCIRDTVPQFDVREWIVRRTIHRNIHLQPEIANRVIHEKDSLFPRTAKVLGVGVRAGYRADIIRGNKILDGHPNVGSCADCIKNIEKKLAEWKYDTFFLAVDDRKFLEEIKNYFGEKCIYFERPRVHYFHDAMLDIPSLDKDEENIEMSNVSVRRKNEDYLVEIYLLAQCDGLYASRGTGHNFAYLVNNGRYSHVEFTDLGEYHYAK